MKTITTWSIIFVVAITMSLCIIYTTKQPKEPVIEYHPDLTDINYYKKKYDHKPWDK